MNECVFLMSKTTKDVLIAYDRTAPLYDLLNKFYFFGRDKRFRSMLTESLDLRPGYIVLDLCSGTGLDFSFITKKIKPQGMLLGVDLSSEMLKQSKKKIGSKEIYLVRSDAANLPFYDQIFDAILVSFCLKIIPTYEVAIEELSRVLKVNGRVGVLANHKPTEALKFPGFVLTKLLSKISKIKFEISLRDLLAKKFNIFEDKIIYGGFLRFFVAEKPDGSNFHVNRFIKRRNVRE